MSRFLPSAPLYRRTAPILLTALFEGAEEAELEPRFLEVQRNLRTASDHAMSVLADFIDSYEVRYPHFPR